MPITFKALAGATLIEMSTDCCGTCDNFYHRSYLAGGCKCKHEPGELSINHKKCEHWKIKPMFASEVQKEKDKVKLGDSNDLL